MKLYFRHNRLEMLPENDNEKRFAKTLCNKVEDSNNLMSWYGDVTGETSGYVITWKPERDPEKIGVEHLTTKEGKDD